MRSFAANASLPLDHELLWYRIKGLLGQGGFGITYRADDTNLNQLVAIKEYFPQSICERDTLLDVKSRANDGDVTFEWGLRRFLDEARTLAQFRHPNIVQVRTAFEHHHTAYMVMDLEQGQSLEFAFKDRKISAEEDILALFGPLLHGLQQVHSAGFIHRDIKLENIIVRPNGSPVLVDFGSARHVIGSDSLGLTALVTRGYAPIEQYAQEHDSHPQGPWCDVYSLAAVLYVLVTRRVPPDALSRAARLSANGPDPLVPAAKLGAGRYSPAFLAAIDHGLHFDARHRPQSILEWLADFPASLSLDASIIEPLRHTAEHQPSPAEQDHGEAPTIVRDASASLDGGALPGDDPHVLAALRVLVVDDENYFRSLVLRVLERLGVQHRMPAASGREALALIQNRSESVDVVFLDLRMPGMDGIEFLRELHDTPHRPAIVLLSGVDPDLLRAAENFARSNSLRVLGSVQKPPELATLARLLANYSAVLAPSSPTVVAAARRLSEEELAAGLASNALFPVYQPKIRIGSGALVAVEALARWRMPDGTVLGPGAFIPLAEQTGRIHALTVALMQRAFADGGEWATDGLTPSIAVNVSAPSFTHLRFPDVIESLAASEGLPPDRVILEVTERTVADDFLAMMNILVRLRLKGITLSIDDFGTGYSSLQQLHKLPFTELKIDRAFVAGAAVDRRARSILEASVRLAHDLEMYTTAEGVETAEDLRTATESGCDIAQGYFFARPMPSEDFVAWARRHAEPRT